MVIKVLKYNLKTKTNVTTVASDAPIYAKAFEIATRVHQLENMSSVESIKQMDAKSIRELIDYLQHNRSHIKLKREHVTTVGREWQILDTVVHKCQMAKQRIQDMMRLDMEEIFGDDEGDIDLKKVYNVLNRQLGAVEGNVMTD